MTNRDKSLFSLAKSVSKFSNYKGSKCQIGCVIVQGKRIISSGYNSEKTSTLQKKYNRYRFDADSPAKIHAEVSALTPLIHTNIEFKKIKLFTYREHKDGSLAMSRPCKSCMELIKQLGIQYIYYTTDDGYCEEIID